MSGTSSPRWTARCGPTGCRRSSAWRSGRTASSAPAASTWPPTGRTTSPPTTPAGLRLQASVRISPALLSALPDRLDAALVRAVEASAGPPDADGWVTATVPLESVDLAVPTLLSLGADIEVLAPEELRREIAETAGAVSDRYRAADACGRTAAGRPQQQSGGQCRQQGDGGEGREAVARVAVVGDRRDQEHHPDRGRRPATVRQPEAGR
ncbi:WYL domain-containing protein [Streptomyces sp. NPDC001219]